MCALFTGAPGAPGQAGGRGMPGKGGNDNILMYLTRNLQEPVPTKIELRRNRVSTEIGINMSLS
jgi:hypothetical protein